MHEKFMKLKRVTIPMATVIMIASSLMGCSSINEDEALQAMQDTPEVELEYTTVSENTITPLSWLPLAKLTTHPELRAQLEDYLGITVTDNTKSGILYINDNQNSTLYDACRTKAFSETYLSDADKLDEIGVIATENYTDIDLDSPNTAYITLASYYDLLPSETEAQSEFNGDTSLTRAEAMALVTRATYPAESTEKAKTDESFTKLVGNTQYTDTASYVKDYSYYNTNLTEEIFNGKMTRGEYIYLLYNTIFNESESDAEIVPADLTEITDGGEIEYVDSLKDPSQGIPSNLYTTLGKAVSVGLIKESDIEFDSPITKTEATKLYIKAVLAYDYLVGYTDSTLEAESGVIHLSPDEYQEEAPASDTEIQESTAEQETTATYDEYYAKYSKMTLDELKNVTTIDEMSDEEYDAFRQAKDEALARKAQQNKSQQPQAQTPPRDPNAVYSEGNETFLPPPEFEYDEDSGIH